MPGGLAALRRRLADPRFADLDIGSREVEEWLESAPATATAFIRLFDAAGDATAPAAAEAPEVDAVRRAIEKWRNHFPDLDARAEELADELRLAGATSMAPSPSGCARGISLASASCPPTSCPTGCAGSTGMRGS